MSRDDESEIGHAPTRTPAAGVAAVTPPKSDPPADPHLGHAKTVTPVAGYPIVKPETQPEGDDDLGGRPESDKLQRAVARSRVAEKLFAKKVEVKLGRYHLMEMVGAGGMGVVWGAWDPELDRRVAIKLVKAEMLAARERILIEGQALAKLSHPNVVPVYDVGVVDEQVYLVMEWVRGKNLRAYCRQARTVREIVTVYRAAGEGLSAAHRVGLIHRDFKPDNAMIGDDGRVRVLDFGLARGEVRSNPGTEGTDSQPRPSSDLTRGAGTPRYMPPEQAEGDELTPSVDQYALGVSLREALVGRNADGKNADVPRWLDLIIDRATAREAANRYGSMDELLHALSQDPRTIWRRRLIAAGAIGFAGAAFAVGTLRGSNDVESCAGAADEIAKAWNPTLRTSLVAHLTTLGPYGAEEAKRLAPDLTQYATRWATTHKGVCLANERRELTPQLYDVRLGCLSRAQVALQTVREILAGATKERLPDAIVAERALPEVERCATETSSSTIDPPPSEIKAEVDQLSSDVSKVRYLALAVDPKAATLAARTAEEADKLAYAPLIARARLALGFAVLGDGKGAVESIPEFARARSAALRAGDRVTFVEAYAREVFALTRAAGKQKTIDVDATHELVEDLARGTKSDGVFARTLLLNNLGTRQLSAGDIPAARVYFERALAEPQFGKRDVELNVILGNLAIATEDPQKRRALFIEERQNFERELGANHPFTITNWMRGVAHTLDQPNEAAKELREMCERLKKWHPDSQKRIDTCSYELGWLAAERGDADEMRSAMSAVKLKDNDYVRVAQGYLLLADGKNELAARDMEAYGAEKEKELGWWGRNVGANAFMVGAMALEKLDRPDHAASLLQRALAIYNDPTINKSASYYKRRVARVRAMLAKLIAKKDPETAKSLAKEALAWYREAGGYESTIAELEAL